MPYQQHTELVEMRVDDVISFGADFQKREDSGAQDSGVIILEEHDDHFNQLALLAGIHAGSRHDGAGQA